ncbi:tubulin polymerization-promoting protein family member 3-like [Dreissena polymorpha]|uniref:Tubulin polymerization-promoting protein family member 3 n=1 Tax=Dreissena polymorpha TaxID=45954 RepID=A0A9D4M7A8_DREPO|nr:tubulin polymerization-promoting protein family member 3-like [Dreissena polymorpha]XP_052266670.1 tubulin polymerization-promoting protein family member 3-like [Dreissena polymorpha]KAH3872227.1 hypothetical protein DPMN_035442 [Dreissena polymorpha]
MASGGVDDDLVKKFEEFCTLAGSKDKTQMTPKANGKLVADCLDKKYKAYDVKAICDASVFPAVKEKGKPNMVVNKANVDKYITKTAHEIAKKKTKNTKIAEDDAEVKTLKAEIVQAIKSAGPNVKVVKTSATGGVDKMTDASQYTGAHKERFDATTGKGKGADGRTDKVENTGYVGQYKGKDTFGKK